MTKFSIIIPTFNHGKLIRYPIESILQQTEKSWELFVIGDGSPAITEKIVNSYSQKYKNIHYIKKPKGPRNGEIYRDELIKKHVKGSYICYLSDDDMYFPDHLALLEKSFKKGYDYVSTYGVNIIKNSEYHFWPADLSSTYFKKMILRGENRIPLSNGSHTKTLYKKLPYGWRTTPVGTPTDLYMWQQILAVPKIKTGSVLVPTVLHFASTDRKTWSESKRLSELDTWFNRLKSNPDEIRKEMGQALFTFSASHEEYIVEREKLFCGVKVSTSKDQVNQILDSKIGPLVRLYFSLKKRIKL